MWKLSGEWISAIRCELLPHDRAQHLPGRWQMRTFSNGRLTNWGGHQLRRAGFVLAFAH
jgi:hypothetical protein